MKACGKNCTDRIWGGSVRNRKNPLHRWQWGVIVVEASDDRGCAGIDRTVYIWFPYRWKWAWCDGFSVWCCRPGCKGPSFDWWHLSAVFLRNSNKSFSTLCAHENIDVKFYNSIELNNIYHVNYRMHDKYIMLFGRFSFFYLKYRTYVCIMITRTHVYGKGVFDGTG